MNKNMHVLHFCRCKYLCVFDQLNTRPALGIHHSTAHTVAHRKEPRQWCCLCVINHIWVVVLLQKKTHKRKCQHVCNNDAICS